MKNWERKKLGDICGFVRGPFGGSLKKNIFKPEGYAVFEQQHAIYDQFDDIRYFIDEKKFNEMKRFELNSGDLIMSCSGTMGKIAIVPENIKKGIINQALLKLSPSKKISTVFLKLWMQSESFQESLKEYSGGAAIQNVASVAILKQIEIPLPPLPEQQRIVSILDEAFAAIAKAKANAEQNLKNAKELFESLLNSLIIDDGKLKMLKLGDVCEIKGRIGYRGYTVQDLVQKGEGAITLSPSNIQDNKFITNKCTYISWFKYEESPEIMVFEGDILFVKTGSTYGKVALVENLPEKATINPQFVVLKDIKCSNRFLYYALTTNAFKEKVENIVGGAATPTLSQTNLAEQTIPLPSLKDQQSIVRQLDALRAETQKLEVVYQKKIDDLEELKKSILQKAFAGELKTEKAVSV